MARASHRSGGRHQGPPRAGRRRLLAVGLVILSLLAVGLGWAVASPLGGSPDDDYHLASIWCPQPVEESCRTAVIEGEVRVEVPQRIGDFSPCYAFRPEVSAECSLSFSDDQTRWARRYDAGNYPGGFYQFHHLLVSDRPIYSVLAMRAVNVVIAVGLLSAVGVLLPAAVRRAYLFASAASLVPMGVYFIASNNPSSWAMTGVLAYAAGLYGASVTEGRRRWALTGLAGTGALLCCLSRFDAAFYLFVVSMALLFAVRWSRRLWPQAVVAVVASAAGIYLMLAGSSGSSSGPQEPVVQDHDLLSSLLLLMRALPGQLVGVYGLDARAGWGDIPFASIIPVSMFMVAGATCLWGLRTWSWRKGLATLMVAGAFTGIPLVMALTGVFPRFIGYQARYVLPLLPVLLLVLLLDVAPREDVLHDGVPVLTRAQAVLVTFPVWLAATWAHYTVLHRYVQGMDEPDIINLDFLTEWWWTIPVSPMAVWVLTSLASAVVCVGLARVLSSPPATEPADGPGDAPASTSPGGEAGAEAEQDSRPERREPGREVAVGPDESDTAP